VSDLRKAAVPLVVLGGVLAGVCGFQPMYVVTQTVSRETWTFTTSLWGTRTYASTEVYVESLMSDAVPVLLTAVLMVVAAVLTLRDGKVARAARVGVIGAAGAFAGIVLAFVIVAIQQEERANGYDFGGQTTIELTYLPGIYLLSAAAIIAIVGAALAQRPRPVAQPEPDEEAVVVHQFMDDDTPPFGIAMPHEEEAR